MTKETARQHSEIADKGSETKEALAQTTEQLDALKQDIVLQYLEQEIAMKIEKGEITEEEAEELETFLVEYLLPGMNSPTSDIDSTLGSVSELTGNSQLQDQRSGIKKQFQKLSAFFHKIAQFFDNDTKDVLKGIKKSDPEFYAKIAMIHKKLDKIKTAKELSKLKSELGIKKQSKSKKTENKESQEARFAGMSTSEIKKYFAKNIEKVADKVDEGDGTALLLAVGKAGGAFDESFAEDFSIGALENEDIDYIRIRKQKDNPTERLVKEGDWVIYEADGEKTIAFVTKENDDGEIEIFDPRTKETEELELDTDMKILHPKYKALCEATRLAA